MYHGSANSFNAFDHKYIARAEGLQVRGWGTYVAKNQSVRYAKVLGKKPKFMYDGVVWDTYPSGKIVH